METLSLKSLSIKVLQGNSLGNTLEKKGSYAGNFLGQKFPLKFPVSNEVSTEVSKEISLENYHSLFSLALSQVAALDPQGEAPRVVMADSTAWGAIQAAEETVNEIWKQAQGGRQVWAEYQAAVRNWQRLFTQALNLEKRLSRIQDGRTARGKG